MRFPAYEEPEASLEVFEELVRKHESSIYRVAYRLSGNRDDAEDLIQEALIEAFEAFPRFKEGTRFDRWIYRIMTNTHIDIIRKRGRSPRTISMEAGVSDDGTPLVIETPDSTNDPALRLMALEFSEPLQRSLDTLSPESRAILVLADVEGQSYEEVARAVGCPVGTVRSRLHRARMALKNMLSPYLGNGRPMGGGPDAARAEFNLEELK
jgi:RNA polymerase sigma-70 factor (ECF subfamily)